MWKKPNKLLQLRSATLDDADWIKNADGEIMQK